jgi:endonuclease/exonuclease/phosphatase family metal-dependent hydrolase
MSWAPKKDFTLFSDTWHTGRTRRNDDLNTFHNFHGAKKGTFRIDWILTRGQWECDTSEVFVFSREGQFPSDHHPVRSRLRLK